LEGTQNSRVIAKGNRELMEKLLNFLESYYPEVFFLIIHDLNKI